MRRRILLADDSVTIQKVIELTFLDEDYEVKAVSNGDEAIAALPQVNPDFVIADVHMPGANGYEVCRRSKEMRPEVPVLLLVGTFEPFDEGQSHAVGADSFLKKPFDSQELLQRVEDLLAARSGAGASAAGLSTAASAAVPPPPSNDDFLAMPALSELPPIDHEPSPSPFAAPPPSPTDWGSFQLEPTVDAIAEPADPFPTSFPAPDPFPARAESPFDDSPFQLDAEPLAGGALQVDESALLPAGEPLFELDSEPTEPDVIDELGDTGGLRAGEFGDATPALETPSFDSFDSPSFETPSYETPSYETPSFQTPSFEQPSYTAPSFETPSLETPAFEPPPFQTPSFETPSFEPPPLGVATTPEERLGVPQGAVPLVESRDEMEARIEAPPPPSIEVSHEPESTPVAAPAPLTVGTVTPAAAPPAATNGGGRLSDEDVDRIARRVVELMADKAIRDVAWEVIPDMAEVVIRDRLRELESQAESFE